MDITAEKLEEMYLSRRFNNFEEHEPVVEFLFREVEKEICRRMKGMHPQSPDDASLVYDEMNEAWSDFRVRLKKRLSFISIGGRFPIHSFKKMILDRKPEFFVRWVAFRERTGEQTV